jgi:hypothetical protein
MSPMSFPSLFNVQRLDQPEADLWPIGCIRWLCIVISILTEKKHLMPVLESLEAKEAQPL